MINNDKKSRREFLGDALRGASLAAMGSLVSVGLPRDAEGVSRESIKTLSSMVQIDPKNILYEETGEPIPTGLGEALALTVDRSGNLSRQAIRPSG
jgi:hypothetical protein